MNQTSQLVFRFCTSCQNYVDEWKHVNNTSRKQKETENSKPEVCTNIVLNDIFSTRLSPKIEQVPPQDEVYTNSK